MANYGGSFRGREYDGGFLERFLRTALYDRDAGELRWRESCRRRRVAAMDSCSREYSNGVRTYCRIWFEGRLHQTHRIVWGLEHGKMPPPDRVIDHIDGNGTNNHHSNLRCVQHQQNSRNRKLHANNKSGVPGVFSVGEKWCVQIRAHGKIQHIGTYKTIEQAAKVRRACEKKFGYHENHGRVEQGTV